jgi:hypothetical protein
MHALENPALESTAPTAKRLQPPRVSSLFFWPFLLFTLLMILDPTNPGVDTPEGNLRLARDFGPLKYAAIVFGWIAMIFSMVGMSFSRAPESTQFVSACARSWPIAAFAALLLAGSLIARLAFGTVETFLGAAVALSAYFIGLAYAFEAREPIRLVRTYFVFLLAMVPYMTWHIVDHSIHGGHAFHEDIFLVIPLAVYFYLATETRRGAWLWVLAFTVIAILSYKNTSFLVLLMVYAYLVVLAFARTLGRERGDSLRRVLTGYGMVVFVVLGALIALYVFIHFDLVLPSGSATVRMRVYGLAWERFLESPIYGTAFTDNTNMEFALFPILGEYRVVMHSDVLDALAHGGAIGFALFAASYLTPLRLGRLRHRPQDPQLRACLHGMRAIALGGIVVMIFNPLALNVQLSSVYWLNSGMLVALAWRYREPDRGVASDNN